MPRTKPTHELIGAIAKLQKKRVALLDAAGAAVAAVDKQISDVVDATTKQIEMDRTGKKADAVADALMKHAINVGQLSNRFSQAVERFDHKIYPHEYTPIRSDWDLTEDFRH